MARAPLDEQSIVLRERAAFGAVLQVQYPERRIDADRRAQDRLDAVLLDAASILEPRVVERGGSHDGLARRDGLSDDAPRERCADGRYVVIGASPRDPEARRLRFLRFVA